MGHMGAVWGGSEGAGTMEDHEGPTPGLPPPAYAIGARSLKAAPRKTMRATVAGRPAALLVTQSTGLVATPAAARPSSAAAAAGHQNLDTRRAACRHGGSWACNGSMRASLSLNTAGALPQKRLGRVGHGVAASVASVAASEGSAGSLPAALGRLRLLRPNWPPSPHFPLPPV